MTIYHVLAVGFVMALCLAVFGIRTFGRNRRTARLIESTPVTPIQLASDGYVALNGTIEPLGEGPIRTPLTDTPCCWYRYRIEEQNTAGKQGWTVVQQGQSVWPFLLRDAGGLCAVDPTDAEFFPLERSVWYGDTRQPTDRHPPRLRWSDAAEFRTPTDETYFNGIEHRDQRYRYIEERLSPGDRLHVLGEFERGTEPYLPSEEEPDDEEETSEPLPLWEDQGKALRCPVLETPHWIASLGLQERYPFLISGFALEDCVRYHRSGKIGALCMGLLGAVAAVGLFLAGVYQFMKPPAP